MKKFLLPLLSVIVSFVFLTACSSTRHVSSSTASLVGAANQTTNTAVIPVPRAKTWVVRHEGFVAIAQKGGVDLLFMGDSITDGWRTRGANVWAKYYAPLHAANFGIGGDQTQHVLWRIDNGELDGINPKVIVLMIGTNNGGSNSPAEIAYAIKVIIDTIQAKCPDTKILLLGVFPRNRKNDTQAQIEAPAKINKIIARYDNGKTVRYLNINKKFIGPDGKVPAAIMPDFLHPNEHGYQIWADAMEPLLAKMMK